MTHFFLPACKQFSIGVLLLAIIACTSTWAHDSANDPDHIAVVGVGEIEAEPDQAVLSVRVFAQEPELKDAKRVADKRYANTLQVLRKHKINNAMIKATQIIAQPQYEWRSNKRVFKGHLVSRTLQITINDLKIVSMLMQELVENDVSTIEGIRTGFQNREALMQQALAAASDNAKAKAEFLTTRLGRSLGNAFKITEHNQSAPKRMVRTEMARFATAADAPPEEVFGTEKVRAQVNVSFYLL